MAIFGLIDAVLNTDTFKHRQMKKEVFNQKAETRGGRRPGAGRKSEGKAKITVTLNEENVKKAKAKETNFSGLLDRLLSDWIAHAH